MLSARLSVSVKYTYSVYDSPEGPLLAETVPVAC